MEAIEDKKEEIAKLEKALDTTNKLVSDELQRELQTPLYKVMTQAEYNQKQLERKNALVADE